MPRTNSQETLTWIGFIVALILQLMQPLLYAISNLSNIYIRQTQSVNTFYIMKIHRWSSKLLIVNKETEYLFSCDQVLCPNFYFPVHVQTKIFLIWFIFLAQNIVSNQNCKKSSRGDGDHWQTAHNVYHVFGTRSLQHSISILQQFRMTSDSAKAQRDTCPVSRCPPSPSSGRKKPHQYSSLLSPRPPPTWPGRRRYDEGW